MGALREIKWVHINEQRNKHFFLYMLQIFYFLIAEDFSRQKNFCGKFHFSLRNVIVMKRSNVFLYQNIINANVEFRLVRLCGQKLGRPYLQCGSI